MTRYPERLRPVLQLMRSSGYRRNRRDDEQFRLLCAAVLRADSSCIDIGANEGALLSDMVEVAPYGRHIAYEPLPVLAARLRERFPSVDVREAGVSNTSGRQPFTHVRNDPALSGIGPRDWHSDAEVMEIDVETIDTGLPDGFEPALIKIDVEGMEAFLLDGARQTLARSRPVIAFEHAKAEASREIYDLLCGELSYRLFDMDGRGPLTWDDFRRDVENDARWNFVASP